MRCADPGFALVRGGVGRASEDLSFHPACLLSGFAGGLSPGPLPARLPACLSLSVPGPLRSTVSLSVLLAEGCARGGPSRYQGTALTVIL